VCRLVCIFFSLEERVLLRSVCASTINVCSFVFNPGDKRASYALVRVPFNIKFIREKSWLNSLRRNYSCVDVSFELERWLYKSCTPSVFSARIFYWPLLPLPPTFAIFVTRQSYYSTVRLWAHDVWLYIHVCLACQAVWGNERRERCLHWKNISVYIFFLSFFISQTFYFNLVY
jgi:hypothetical protein